MRMRQHRGRPRRARPIVVGAVVGFLVGLGPLMASGTPPSDGEGASPSTDGPPVAGGAADAACDADGVSSCPAEAPGPDVTASKSADPPGPVGPGGSIAYTVTVANEGDATATGVMLHDDLPGGLHVVLSAFPSFAGRPCTVASSVGSGGVPRVSVDCGPVSLDAGESASVTVQTEVDEGTCGTLTNVATVESTNEPDSAATNNASNEVATTVECEVSSPPDLEVVKTSDADGVPRLGDPVHYTIGVTNVGDEVAGGVEVHDVLPVGARLGTTPFPTLEGRPCILASSVAPGGVPRATVDCGPVRLDPGATTSVLVTIFTGVCGTITNVVDVEASNEPADRVGPENHAKVTDAVACPPGIELAKGGPHRAHVGDTITYTFAVTNDGGTDLTDVDLADPGCDGPIARIADGDGDPILAVDERWRYACEHTITSGDGDPVRTVARVQASHERGLVADRDDHSVDVLHPDLSIRETAAPTSATDGSTIVYTYVVTNTGDAALFDVVVSDDRLGPVGEVASLRAGAGVRLRASLTLGSSPVTSVATAWGEDVLGRSVSATDSATVTVAAGTEEGGGGGSPFTGAETGSLAVFAVVLGAAGAVLVAAGRRRRPAG